MKNILGLDLGTASIGWAVIQRNDEKENISEAPKILCAGSRIIPMAENEMTAFNKAKTKSPASNRTTKRSTRKMIERVKIRRERLNRVLAILDFLPSHYAECLDGYGKLLKETEPKIEWVKDATNQYHFLFEDSYNEMVALFKKAHPSLKNIPHDWTIYYLRKKGLTKPLTNYELAWVLHNFNAKRGYNQLRSEESEDKEVKYQTLKVISVEELTDKKYKITFEDGRVWEKSAKSFPDWVGTIRKLIVTTKTNKDGTKNYKFDEPKEEDWTLIKKKTEQDIESTGKKVGEYIFDSLLKEPSIKIIGGLVRHIDRKFYKDELEAILKTQVEFSDKLNDSLILKQCIEALYPNNELHRLVLENSKGNPFINLLIDDIIFYQRPLKSKKYLISDCPYESNHYIDKSTGEEIKVPLKCIPKSHPLYCEFRLWQWIYNLKIGNKKVENCENLYQWLNDKKEVKQSELQKFLNTKEEWNYNKYNKDKAYPCNPTRAEILSRLKSIGVGKTFLTKQIEEQLWNILYSIDSTIELKKGLATFASNNNLDSEKFVEAFAKFSPFKKEYGAYSTKAIRKLLSVMRVGQYWAEENIDSTSKKHILKIISGKVVLPNNVATYFADKKELADFNSLSIDKATYAIYGRHSEASNAQYWDSYEYIDNFITSFKQHSLRNPIVENIIMETLRTVRDIWKQVGHIDQINIELGREMKASNEERKSITDRQAENEKTNLRIKYILKQLFEQGIKDVRPYSPMQQEKLRIYEDGAFSSSEKSPKDIEDIKAKFSKKDKPTQAEFERYKCWLEQNYCSIYTGKTIPLSLLFTTAYEIEHIIPQSLYFDDSYNNKVICEAEVNKDKSNRLGHKYIAESNGKIVNCSGEKIKLLSLKEYEENVNRLYAKNKAKRENLLADEIPDGFNNRQLNDSRYIAKFIMGILSNIVRTQGDNQATTKNIISCNGKITTKLKEDWGVNDVWNRIVLPRFERLGSEFVTQKNGHTIPNMDNEKLQGLQKKRIDHRHHAMDAIVIACANRSIVNYLNNISANDGSTSRMDLRAKLCRKFKEGENSKWLINKPWPTFTEDLYKTLNEDIIVSFKQNLRVINKSRNIYRKGKEIIKQDGNNHWAIRKALHKETFSGLVNLREIKEVNLKAAIANTQAIVEKDLKKKLNELLNNGYKEKEIKKYFEDNKDVWADIDLKKIKIYIFNQYYATRKELNDKIAIDKITDTGIQKILKAHLESCGGDKEVAFSPEGIEKMNANIVALNGGKMHKPINKVRIYEESDIKFPVGKSGNKVSKFVEAADGTNLYFAIYYDQNSGERKFETIPLYKVVERLKQGLPVAPKQNESGNRLLFTLSPNDEVYIPTKEDIANGRIDTIDKKRIYKVVSFSSSQLYCVPNMVAKALVDKVEFGSQNKSEKVITGEFIKKVCVPIKVDRLGHIISFGQLEKKV